MDELRRVLGFDPAALDADAYLARIRAAAGRVAVAESADGRIRVEFSAEAGVRRIRLDPRVMRMSAADLAAAITQVAGRAHAALATLPAPPDVPAEAEQVADRMLGQTLRDAEELARRLRRPS